ncbi:MFS transporter [Cylindrospermopsis raciborskii CHAB3438]|uniref:MFS transporter n=1 Tax=Cylindrospermopsis raciborskii TaxID=77022 RepID=UPI001F0F1A46|nr:MFS transporter [Cylindrospermopsis raciborskii]MCH4903618.1 MFS transporter [Cylindrospermopsis raciborskii CHAB3438]MEB3146176.1 MFS transporter [Cylindrospermopsis raciborskii]
MSIFRIIWLGQLFYLIGISMTSFALNISVFRQTGSATQFALLMLTCTIPPIIISPVAGTLVDKWDRRMTMIIAHILMGFLTLSLLVIATIGQIEIWQIYLINIFTSIIGTFSNPAYKAAITSLVPPEDLSRASGMVQLSMGIQQIVGPLIAGAILDAIHLQGILTIDFLGLLIALTTLISVKFGEKIHQTEENNYQPSISFLWHVLWRDVTDGWTYLIKCPGLTSLVIILIVYQFSIGFVTVLFYPLALSLTTPSELGKIVFLSGISMILGSLLMSIWKYQWQNLITTILIAMSLSGMAIAIGGSRPSLLQMYIGTILFFFNTPLINGMIQILFQTRVAENLQGRVFALTGAISSAAIPLASIIAAPLSDYVFEPLMGFDGNWSKALIGQLIGTGPGRGTGLLFVIVGCFITTTAIIASQHPKIRQLELAE